MATIGKSITIKGDLSGSEDIQVEGTVEGKIDLPDNEVTVGAEGRLVAQVHAKNVVVIGRIQGNVSAVDKIEVQENGKIDGDVRAPRLIVHEGATLNGSVEMGEAAKRPAATASAPAKAEGTTPEVKAAAS
ncbi:MAG: polymer-forming cytoskeletal protein [Myxococcota bacterium]|nr:polymer-forming cytoskeletal protein [Myxococcota bacterium]